MYSYLKLPMFCWPAICLHNLTQFVLCDRSCSIRIKHRKYISALFYEIIGCLDSHMLVVSLGHRSNQFILRMLADTFLKVPFPINNQLIQKNKIHVHKTIHHLLLYVVNMILNEKRWHIVIVRIFPARFLWPYKGLREPN